MSTTQLGQLVSEFVTLTALGGSQSMIQGLLDDDNDSQPGNKDSAAAQLSRHVEAQRDAWKDLIADYRSLAPPNECVSIADSYGQAVGETRQMVMEVLDHLVRAASDPSSAVSALMSMRGTSGNRIDVAAKEADNGIQAVCVRYGESKWFSVSSDVGSEFSKLASDWSP